LVCAQKTIAQVLVHLHRGDYVAAEKCVRESYSIPGFSGSEDCVAVEQLLQGYDEQDEEQVSLVCTSPLLRYMDDDYAKLAISLKVPGGGKKKAAAAAGRDSEVSAGAAPPEEEEDEYAGGLC
ncbi:N-ethylmaleimide-sensitive factor attachment protein, gamma a, partial [Cyprinus carpio]|uniref:N-ethylmaleimide-sensitive factor attachment protein, gamma a n=1 Tax=Cyprinus carpio TaxID=7962 RepID=A0A9Q9V3R8_CYPCA